jgi:hypothetical protein
MDQGHALVQLTNPEELIAQAQLNRFLKVIQLHSYKLWLKPVSITIGMIKEIIMSCSYIN